MKRFLVDFILILILVMLGSSMNYYSDIEDRIQDFEENIEEDVIQQSSPNKATQIIKKSGDMIEEVVSISVEVISSIFKAIIE